MKVQRIQDVQGSAHKKHKSKKKPKRRFALVRSLLVTVLLAATLVYGALSPLFNIKNITVKGEPGHYDKQTLVADTGIIPGVNGFRLLFRNPGKFYFLRVGSAEKSILEKCPYVKSVIVRYIIPSTITVEIKERTAEAVLIADGTSLLIDREEVLLEVDPDLKNMDLPVIKIKKPKELKPGKKLDLKGNELSTAFKIYDTIKEMDSRSEDKLLPDVDYIDVTDPGKAGFLLQSRINVRLGDLDDLIYKLNAVKTVFANNIKKDEKGKLDFTLEGNPVFTPESGR